MAKAPNRDTIQPKERVQSTSETLPPTIFANWAVDPSHQPQVPSTVSVLPIGHQDFNNSTNSDSSSDYLYIIFCKKMLYIPCTKTRGSRGNHRSCPA